MADTPDQTVLDNPVATDWRSGIAEEDRSTVARFDTVGSLAKGYKDLYTDYSGRVKLPTDESTPEEKSSFYTQCGRPETSDGYTRPELPEGKEYDEALIGGMQTLAFDAGITNSQFGKLIERYLEIEGKKVEASETEAAQLREVTDRELKELWHVDYDKNIEIAQRAKRELVTGELGEQFTALLDESGLGNNSVFVQVLHAIGSKTLSDTLVTSDGAPPKPEKGFVPSHPNSPDMYANGEDEESKKSRAYFTARGHTY